MSSAALGCVICGATAARPDRERDGYRYVSCAACGAVRLDPLPSADAAAATYDESYFAGSEPGGYRDYVADEALHRRNARRHLRRAARAGAGPPGVLLEIGCAAGFLLDEARARGWQVHGVEVSEAMRATSTGFGLHVADTIENLDLAAGSVDIVVLNQVLEHVVDPSAMVDQVASLLRVGGLVSIETWDRDSLIARLMGEHWQQVSPPSVLWLFSGRDLTSLLVGHGLRPLRLRPAVKLVSVATVTGQVASRGSVGRAVASTANAAGLGRLSVPYSLGDLVVALARRAS